MQVTRNSIRLYRVEFHLYRQQRSFNRP